MRRKLSTRYISLALATFVLTAGAAPREATEADDLKKMQGDWMVLSMTASGMKYPDEEAQSLFRTIEGNNYQVSRYSKPIGTGTFKIDPSATPKTIDSSPATDPSKPILGIYEFEGETLKICNGQPGKPRPSDFQAKAAFGHTLIVWQREKQ